MQSRTADCPRVVGVFVCESLGIKQSELHLTNYALKAERERDIKCLINSKARVSFLTSELLENKPIRNIMFSSERT